MIKQRPTPIHISTSSSLLGSPIPCPLLPPPRVGRIVRISGGSLVATNLVQGLRLRLRLLRRQFRPEFSFSGCSRGLCAFLHESVPIHLSIQSQLRKREKRKVEMNAEKGQERKKGSPAPPTQHWHEDRSSVRRPRPRPPLRSSPASRNGTWSWRGAGRAGRRVSCLELRYLQNRIEGADWIRERGRDGRRVRARFWIASRCCPFLVWVVFWGCVSAWRGQMEVSWRWG